MAEVSTHSQEKSDEKKAFICGVIEGFYGRPWTTDQRKDLFRKLKKWGMDSYVYAPKDDYKHRAYWRELYTVEEADHLSSLIAAAKDQGITFYYALSPGLDMSYSSQKEIQTLKRKLDQVSQFGCKAFALLFDDIESELSKTDKEAFQTFANAQVSVTNEIFSHLGCPRFLFCPTQYCSTRALPTVHDSEYLNTLGSKLNHDIDIMWTGNKVISKTITLESIQEITEVLRRPPVIWDNLHANDYDQKRVFLGPYSGRSPELIPNLRGVMTNPNCEFYANTIAIHTLAYWSKCSLDSKLNSSLSADIKLETEDEDGSTTDGVPTDCCLQKNVYHPRIALKNAITEWLPEFFVEKEAFGPITKPQPQVTIMPIIPIIPSINTCMSLTTTTTTTSTCTKTVALPEVNTTQLQALADVCSTVNSSSMNPISNSVMNSLVSATKVVTNDEILNPITTTVASNIELPKKVPISIVSVPIMHPKTVADVVCAQQDDSESGKSEKNDLSFINDIAIKLDAVPSAKECEESLNNTKANLSVNESGGTTNGGLEKVSDDQEDVNATEKVEETTAHGTIELELNKKPDTELNLIATETVNMLEENNEPMECSSLPSQASPSGEVVDETGEHDQDAQKAVSEDVVMAGDTLETGSNNDLNNKMQVESSEPSPQSTAEMRVDEEKTVADSSSITTDDLFLLCDLFYLPFEHGNRGTKLLNDFNWLKANAHVLLTGDNKMRKSSNPLQPRPEVTEWLQRAESFSALCSSVQELLKKIANCANKEICHDLFSYVWDITGALTLLNAFVKWLSLGHFSHKVYSFTQGTFTWFSKGWKEAFMSGDQEPWMFRGGLTADLQRLMPVETGDLFLYRLPEMPTSDYHTLRPYTPIDESDITVICNRVFKQMRANECDNLTLPEQLRELVYDSKVGHFITLHPELCIVAHDSSNAIVGYAATAKDISVFRRNIEVCWLPAMREKYPKTLLDSNAQITGSKNADKHLTAMIKELHDGVYDCPTEVISSHPAAITVAMVDDAPTRDQNITKRLLTMALATLRANGCFGVHVHLMSDDTQLAQFYSSLGFSEIYHDTNSGLTYMGRRF